MGGRTGQKTKKKKEQEQRYHNILEDALLKDAEGHGNEHLITYAISKARVDTTVLNSILDRILPKLKSVEVKADPDNPYRLIMDFSGAAKREHKPKSPAKPEEK